MTASVVSLDFETTTNPEDCRVWLWAARDVGGNGFAWGRDIKTFMRHLSGGSISKGFFHNLNFDGRFIIDFLMKGGYRNVRKYPKPGQFSVLMSSRGKMYQIEICFKNKTRVKLWDSLKLFPMSVAKLSEVFGTSQTKGEIDYSVPRPVGYAPTDVEMDYIKRDVGIVAEALAYNFAQGMDKMTVGANALADFKERFGRKRFDKMFPSLSEECDAYLRRAYRGGFTYCAPEWAGKVTGPGISVDYNSMYPSMMTGYPFPCGEPVPFAGKYRNDPAHPLFVQEMTVCFKTKPQGLPVLQLRNCGWYGQHEYVAETVEPVSILVTSADLEIMHAVYDLDVLEYTGGMKFRAETGLFDCYIDHWRRVKETNTGAMRTLSKFMLNNLYGKFGTNPDVTGKLPVLDDDGVVRFKLGDPETRKPPYLPVALYATAYARRELLRAIMANRSRFVYCDTDSMHLIGTELPEGIRLHDSEFMAWKVEGTFDRSKHLRAKSYVLDHGGELDVKCAGMPDNIKAAVTFDNFEYGFSNVDETGDVISGLGKLTPQPVPGGVVLRDSVYMLHP